MARITRIHYSLDFRKSYKKLAVHMQNRVDRKDALFRENPYDPSLGTHRLHGHLNRLWSFRITREYRVLFEFIGDNEVLFYDIGTHGIYQ